MHTVHTSEDVTTSQSRQKPCPLQHGINSSDIGSTPPYPVVHYQDTSRLGNAIEFVYRLTLNSFVKIFGTRRWSKSIDQP
jgi:hypothetical protein